jgi:thiamine-phosphate pyrophosphorylase
MSVPRLHLVTDDRILAGPSFLDQARAVAAACGGGAVLQLRGHGTRPDRLLELAERLVAADGGALLVVNDRVDVALASAAAGVHLGRRSLPPAVARALFGRPVLIGYLAHSAAEAGALAGSVDYAFLGPIHETTSHPGSPLGPAALGDAARGVPLIAIGGITAGRVADAIGAGAYGVAVRSAVWGAADPAAVAASLLELLQAGVV